MRTTLVIEDAALRRAKAIAARSDDEQPPFSFPTFGVRAKGKRVDHSPAELYAATEADELPRRRAR